MIDTPIFTTAEGDPERRWSAVEAKLAAHAGRLAEQGGLVAMRSASGRRVWVVRFADESAGRRVHRSIYVGGDERPELLRRTRAWLDHCRVKGRVAAEVAGLAALAVAACKTGRPSGPRAPASRRAGPALPRR